jgi:hypothetical protein
MNQVYLSLPVFKMEAAQQDEPSYYRQELHDIAYGDPDGVQVLRYCSSSAGSVTRSTFEVPFSSPLWNERL